MNDHYVPGSNAHIDTSEFEANLAALAGSSVGDELMSKGLEVEIYQLIRNILSSYPEEPAAGTIICRYFTIEKFLWFLRTKSIYFGSATEFDDHQDCAIPTDYAEAISKFYLDRECIPLIWGSHVDDVRRSWLISCWTEVTGNIDDYLLWHRYASGPSGVGVTVRYQDLKEALLPSLHEQGDSLNKIGNLCSGYVSYEQPLRLLPFNKRQMFRNEKEVRFVGSSDILASTSVSVESIFSKLGLRLSPDASQVHCDSVIETWQRFGGNDNIVITGS